MRTKNGLPTAVNAGPSGTTSRAGIVEFGLWAIKRVRASGGVVRGTVRCVAQQAMRNLTSRALYIQASARLRTKLFENIRAF